MASELTWQKIIKSDTNQLKKYCDEFELSTRGDQENLKERLLRHIFSISLPECDMFLEGKVNINTATPREMSFWPYMGETLVDNIVSHREKYGRFNKVEELLSVKGVGSNLFEILVQFIDVTGKTRIRVKRRIDAELDTKLMKLEDDIRNKAWELQDMKDYVEIELTNIRSILKNMKTRRKEYVSETGSAKKLQKDLGKAISEVEVLGKELETGFKELEEVEKAKESELGKAKNLREKVEKEASLQREKIKGKITEITGGLDPDVPWQKILGSDINELRELCDSYDISHKGDEISLKDRLLRHSLKVTLPKGEILLEGKLNINTANADEMSVWPYMGNTLIRNIMDYRKKYGRFNKIGELKNVKGVGPQLFKKLLPIVDVTGETHIRIKKDNLGKVNAEIIALEDQLRNRAWELGDIKEHIALDLEYLHELISALEREKDNVNTTLEGKNSEIEDEKEKLTSIRENLSSLQDELTDLETKKKSELENRENKLRDKEKELNDIAFGLGADSPDLEVATGDLPVIVELDPDDPNKEDDTVILYSMDGLVQRKLNISEEGKELDEKNTEIIFKNIPGDKTYNVMVDTGEEKYYLVKNFRPGGEE